MDDSEFSYIIKMKQTSNVQETCLQIVITHWTVSSLKTTKKTNLDQQISNRIGLIKHCSATLFCWILKIMNPFYHFHWSSKILTNLLNPATYLIITPLKITRKKIQSTKSSNFICRTFFLCTYTQAYSTPSIY
jgi:hypothetical protein